MAGNSTNITEKNYRKLVLRVSLQGFSFCIVDTLENAILVVEDIDFSHWPKTSRIEDHYWKSFLENTSLTREYDEVVALHDNNLNTFVPKAMFDEEYLGSYLQYNTKVFETDFFAFDDIPNHEINNVYIPYVNINNFLIDQFGTFDYKHCNTVLVEKLLAASKNVDDKQVYVHFGTGNFSIVVVQNQSLLLFNAFDYKTPEDFIYYLLFTAEQLNLNPETFRLRLLGIISEDSELFKIAFKYVRNVALAEFTFANDFSLQQNLQHFILFQS